MTWNLYHSLSIEAKPIASAPSLEALLPEIRRARASDLAIYGFSWLHIDADKRQVTLAVALPEPDPTIDLRPYLAPPPATP